MANVILSLACKDCGADFGDWTSLFDHVIHCTEQFSPKSADVTQETTAAAGSSQTSVTSSSSNDKNTTVNQAVASGTGRYACICGLSYSSPNNLVRHQKKKGCVMVKSSAPGPFFCPYPGCGKKIQYERNYLSHLKFHEEHELKWAIAKSQESLPDPENETESVPQSYETLEAAAIDVQMEIEL